jgi:integrase
MRQGTRDAAILTFGYALGLKSGELRRLKSEDYISSTRSEKGDPLIKLPDRREGSRQLPLVGHPKEIARLWHDKRHGHKQHFFYPMSKRGKTCGGELTQEGLHKIVRRRGNQARGPAPSPQKLRSSFKTLVREMGTSDAIVRDLMGLRSRRTTERDDETANQKMREALKSVAHKTAPDGRIPRPSGAFL